VAPRVAGVHDAGVPEAAVRWSADPDLPGRPRPAPLRLHQDLRTYPAPTRVYTARVLIKYQLVFT